VRCRIALALFAAAIAGCGDESPLPPGPQGPTDAVGTVAALGDFYEAQNLAGFTALLSDDFVFVRDWPDPETGATEWNAVEERALHARMFDPGSIPAGDVPLHGDLWLETVNVTLTPLVAFAERTDLYTAANPQGTLDRDRWIARGATYATSAFFLLRGDTHYQVDGRAYFVVLEDRSKQIGEAGKFLLYRWEDLGQIPVTSDAPAVEPKTWSTIKSIYRRGRVAPPETQGLIDRLAESYRTRDLALFSGLLVDDFRFVLDQPSPVTGETEWGFSEERSLHRRMFTPVDRPPGELPVPTNLVVQNIQITLTPVTSFVERRDLYTTANPRGPLDPSHWIARAAIYGTDVFFQLAGATDFHVRGRADFVVLEDRTRQPSDPGKFLLYRWEDLWSLAAWRGTETSGVEAASWSSMKSLYRVPGGVPSNPAALIRTLEDAYHRRDAEDYVALLSPDFLFILDQPNPDTGETNWNAITEARIHHRMFDPQNIPPGDPPLPPELWLQSVTVVLSEQSAFAERPDLYTTADPPGPLDPTRYTASGAVYGTDVFFQLQGETDFQVRGRAYFLVLEDRTKPSGDPGRLQLYRWEDLGNPGDLDIVDSSWSDIKALYK